MQQIQKPKGEGMSAIGRTLAVLAFIAVLVIGMWGSIMIASAVPNVIKTVAAAVVSLTSIFVPAEEAVSLSVPSVNTESGEAFTLSWTHEKKSVQGSYTFRYDCAEEVHFTNGEETIFCNVPFHFLNQNDSMTLTAVSTKNRFIDTTLYIDFTPNGASQPTVTGSKLITVTNETLSGSPTVLTPNTETSTTPTTPTTPVKPTTPKPKPPVTQGPTTNQTYPLATTTVIQTSNPNGYVDFTARIIEVGVVNKTTGEFTASSTPSRSQRIAVRFAVENIGTKTSNQFTFNAVLPTLPSHIFSAPMQQELRPNDRIEFTVGFDSFNPANPNGEFIVNIDPANSQNEKSETNNIVKYIITTIP